MSAGGVASGALAVAGTSMLACSVSRIRAVISRPTAVRFGLAASLVTYATALLIDVGPITRFLDLTVLRRHDVAILLSQILTTATAWCGIEMVIASAGRSSVRGLRVRLGVTILAASWQCATFFLPTTPPPELSVVEFYLNTRPEPAWQAYWISYGVISGLGSVYLGLSSARYARQASLWLGRGMLLISAGSVLCTAFSASIAVSTWIDLPPIAGVVQTVTVACGATLIGIGCVIPQLPDHRARRMLRPTWRVLTNMYPGVRLARSRPDLRRTVTEIQDAVAIARQRDEIASPLMRKLSALPSRSADQYEQTVAELCGVATLKLSPWWDDDNADAESAPRTMSRGEP